MKHAMFLPYDAPDKMIEWAQKLEQAGFDSAWQGELTNSALIPLAAVAPAVKNIKLGAGVVLAFTHSPVMLAFEALDLDYFSQGRFILGLGVAHPNRNNNWYAGRDEGKPVSQMREGLLDTRVAKERRARRPTLLFERAGTAPSLFL